MKNSLKIYEDNRKIFLEWHVYHRSNIEDKSLDKSRRVLRFTNCYGFCSPIFDLGLVMQPLTINLDNKTPENFKKFFYTNKTSNTVKSRYTDKQYLNRLIVNPSFENEYKEAMHMKEFYALWKNYDFGKWNVKYDTSEDDGSGLFPFKVFFEWEYPQFLSFNRFVSDDYSDDMFYLVLEVAEEGDCFNVFEYWDQIDIECVEREEKDNKRKSLMTNISKSKNKLEQLDKKLRDLEPGKQTKLF